MFHHMQFVKKVGKLIKQLLSGGETIMGLFVRVQMRFFNTQANLKDDFDWNKYHLYYKQELKVGEKIYTILPGKYDYVYRDNSLIKINPEINDMSSNHHLLYEVILGLQPNSALEIGCGGGDHLRSA